MSQRILRLRLLPVTSITCTCTSKWCDNVPSRCSDGHPLSVEGVVQLDQYLYSVALKWNESRVPADSPILGYEITVIPEDQGRSVSSYSVYYIYIYLYIIYSHVDVPLLGMNLYVYIYMFIQSHYSVHVRTSLLFYHFSLSLIDSASFTVEVEYNMTATELSPLEPASTYLVTVAGLNSHGKGTASTHVTIMTFVPEGEAVMCHPCHTMTIQCTTCMYIYIHG